MGTPRHGQKGRRLRIEILILLGVILTMTLALVLSRRFYGKRSSAEE